MYGGVGVVWRRCGCVVTGYVVFCVPHADLIGRIVEKERSDIKKECRVEEIEVLWTHGAPLGK